MGGGFLATNSTCAKHGHFFSWLIAPLFLDKFRPLSKGLGFGIDRIFKGAESDLIVVANIHQFHLWVVQQAIPLLRFHILTGSIGWENGSIPEGDNFWAGDDAQAVECGPF